MKNLTIAIFIVLVVVVLGLLLVSYMVRETESVLVTTFGKPTAEITEPGWKFKWPAPIQRFYKFDSRMRVLEAEMIETSAKGAVAIIVKTYVVWKIEEPLKFFNAVRTVKEAEKNLLSQINDVQNKVIGQHYFSEFVNNDESKIKFNQIETEMLADLRQTASDQYGIRIMTLGIKQLNVNEDVTKDVFERMRAERDHKTLTTIAEGKAEAATIEAEASSKKIELLAAAEARAKAIRGEGDAEAAKYYKLMDEDPAFAMFLRDIEALRKILEKRSTIVISADTEPFKLLKEMPTLEPEKK